METSEIHPTFARIVGMYYKIGAWQNKDESRMTMKFFHLIYLTLFSIFFLICGLASDDENEFVFLLETAWCMIIVLIKLMYVAWRETEILEFLYHRAVSFDDEESKQINKKTMRKFMTFIDTAISLICIAYIFAIVSCLPIFTSEKKMPMFITFRLSFTYSEILYWITYGFLVLGLALAVVFNSITVVIWYIMLTYTFDYRALGNALRNLGYRQQLKVPQTVTTKLFLQELICLIKKHRSICE